MDENLRVARGTVIDGWRVVVCVGVGLSAQVYRVINVRSHCEGALKLLMDSSRGLGKRFESEETALRILTLPQLPRYLGSGTYQGRPYYVMEYLQPLVLPLPTRSVAGFIVGVARAVQALHEAGFVHRDLKPDNILLRRNGEPVLIDLGLIKRTGSRLMPRGFTSPEGVSIVDGRPVGVGTLDFAAPEQLLRGESTVQGDIFSLGKTLRACFARKPSHVWRVIIREATAENPSDRYPSAARFVQAVRYRYVSMALAGVTAVCVAGAVATLALLAHRSPPETPPPVIGVLPAPPVPEEPVHVDTVSELLEKAERLFYGKDGQTNYVEAVKLYVRAAEEGSPEAQASLGLCKLRGLGCEENPREAVEWYLKAAQNGSLVAMNDLAYCYLNGIGVTRDEGEGFSWAMQAAELGNAPAQATAGECYLLGRGTVKDVKLAEVWLGAAARQGNRRAQHLLESL